MSSGAVTPGIGGKCMDLNGGNTTDGTAVQLYTCNGAASRQRGAPQPFSNHPV